MPGWFDLPESERDRLCREDAFAEAREQGLPEVMDDPAGYAELGRIFAEARNQQCVARN